MQEVTGSSPVSPTITLVHEHKMTANGGHCVTPHSCEQARSVGFETDDDTTLQREMTLYYQGRNPFVYLENLAGRAT